MPPRSRPLTPAETKLARSVFGSGLRYERIRLHGGAWWLLTRNIASAPFGHVYFPANRFCPDFAKRPLIERAWLVHELTHVWQHQNGFPVWLGGSLQALRLGYLKNRAYRLPMLDTVPHLNRLNMEQQAEIFALYYRAAICHDPAATPYLPQLQRLLQPFFANPKSRELWPKWL